MKALLTAILLIAVAAYVFVAGWTQIVLPPSTSAVLFTKTSGYHSEVLRAGEFSWSWERIIPNNATLFLFDLQPHTFTIRSSGELPSGADLAAVLPTATDFSFDVTISVTLAVRPEALPALMETQGLTPEDLPDWSARYAETIAAAAREMLQRQPATALLDLTALEAEIAEALEIRLPTIELAALRITNVRLPDLELYQHARAIYLGLLDAQDEARRAAVTALAAQREAALTHHQAQLEILDVLRAYGELLEQHPVLLDFLALPVADMVVRMRAPGAGEQVSATAADSRP